MSSRLAHPGGDTLVSAFAGPTAYEDRTAVARVVAEALDALQLPPSFIAPGDRVVLKPNWVKEHDERRPGPDQWEHVVTHPVVIRAVAEWVGERLGSSGSITICDAPQTDSSFGKLSEYCALEAMLKDLRGRFPGLKIEI